MYKHLLRPILFNFDPEKVHDFVFSIISSTNDNLLTSILSKFKYTAASLNTHIAGVNFDNPIGLAAGFDKNCAAVPFWEALGFGHVEIGTVTGEPQIGNSRPRIRRFSEESALVNSMGFPSAGAEEISKQLVNVRSHNRSIKVGVNIGKTKNVPIEEAEKDYLKSFMLLSPYADYVAINVSSPNTPDLRKLQEPERLTNLFQALQSENKKKIPLFVKIAPDLTEAEIVEVLKVSLGCNISGIIASNTTIDRERLPKAANLPGGISGKPLLNKNLSVVSFINKEAKELPIIAVGGIFTIEDVLQYFVAGATLIQLYTGMIYEGPFIVKTLLTSLSKLTSK